MTVVWIAISCWLTVLALFVVLRARATGLRVVPHRRSDMPPLWAGHRR
jgi:hypothetical protein